MTFEEFLGNSGRKLSDEQLKAVCSDRSTVVSAGAGSGKTMVLSLRFLRRVLQGKAHSDEILTLTFTKKAAGEMYERIHSMLSAAGADEELSLHFPQARISTMDSFWSEIARTDCLRYGLTRDFGSLDENDAADMVSAVFDELAEDDGYKASFMSLAAEYSPETLKAIFSSVALGHADILTSFSAEDNASSFDKLSLSIRQSVAERADSVISDLLEIDSRNPSPLSDEIRAAADSYYSGDYSAMPQMNLRRTRNREISSFVKEAYRPVLGLLQELGDLDGMSSVLKDFSKLAEAFISRIESGKRKRGVLSYKDTEALAKAILIANKDVRSYYKKKYKYIMIDEFQDNNASQRDMLYLLSERLDLDGDGIPDIEDTDPDKLFFVGDDKQSIYYFRGADVSVFRSLRNDISRIGGNVLSLSINFRSSRTLLSRFNDIFPDVFSSDEADCDALREEQLIADFTGTDSSSYEADFSPIVPGGKDNPSSRMELSLYPSDAVRDDDDAEPALAEALHVADLINEMVRGDGYPILRGGSLVRPSYSDIAVLIQTTKSQMPFERAFRIKGIPYTVTESASTTLDGVASDLYSFLQLLIYPDDRFAYIALLRSPFARISDAGLLMLSSLDVPAFSPDVQFIDPCDDASYKALCSLYSKARAMIGRESITHILDVLYYEGGYHAYLMSSPELSVYEEHFSYIWTLGESFEASGRSFASFLDGLRPLIGSVEKMKDIAIQHFQADAVEMMTVHKSKGLEYPIVILADATRGLGRQRDSSLVMIDGDDPLVLLEPASCSHPVSRLLSRYSRRREIAERKRVLYVAATRAMDHLVITGVERRSSYSLYSFFALSPEIPSPGMIGNRKISELFPRKDSNDNSSWYGNPLYEEGHAGILRVGVRDSLDDFDNSFMDGEMLPSLEIDTLIASKKLYTLFGTFVHRYLEREVSGENQKPLSDSTLDDKESIMLNDAALDAAKSFRSSSFYGEYVDGNECETEVRFYYPDGDMVLEGSVDLLIHCSDHLIAVDYKTDRIMCPEMHKGQITKYAKAMEGIYGKRCLCCVLYVRNWARSTFWDKDGNEA